MSDSKHDLLEKLTRQSVIESAAVAQAEVNAKEAALAKARIQAKAQAEARARAQVRYESKNSEYKPALKDPSLVQALLQFHNQNRPGGQEPVSKRIGMAGAAAAAAAAGAPRDASGSSSQGSFCTQQAPRIEDAVVVRPSVTVRNQQGVLSKTSAILRDPNRKS